MNELIVAALENIAKMNSGSGTPKGYVAPPVKYDGSSTKKLQTFLLQCQLFFQGYPKSFPNDESKVNFALSYLEGTALEMFQTDIIEGRPQPWMINWVIFATVLNETFGVIDPEGDAEELIDRLRMKDNTRLAKYNVEFQKLQARLDWGENALRFRYYKGLPDRIKDVLATQPKYHRLKDLSAAAGVIDGRHWERKAEQERAEQLRRAAGKGKETDKSDKSDKSGDKKNNNNNSNNGSSSKKSSGGGNPGHSGNSHSNDKPKKTVDISKFLGKDGKLTPEERQRRITNNLCLRCGGSGHKADACPRGAKARAAATEGTAAEGSSSSPKN